METESRKSNHSLAERSVAAGTGMTGSIDLDTFKKSDDYQELRQAIEKDDCRCILELFFEDLAEGLSNQQLYEKITPILDALEKESYFVVRPREEPKPTFTFIPSHRYMDVELEELY
eukprot:TRINITY_DN8475_c0_g1_i1.p1 TRINITY_DN8475_c0_g1~~TRINITY_DN8475_c0_g1_i1.p1  ORF type:complete len:117 (-),score=16.18 TRINITY_DN8475_c0_g1_i1:4-354(-)